tara:strand:+ start:51 stop:638 length:588 start_codon:yes stop_codon:yes gene_type:complete
MKGNRKYKIIPADVVKNLIEFLDEVQFDAATNNTIDDLHKINFCNWAIQELLNSFDGYLRDKPKRGPQKKSRDQYVDETFMDWNLPEMTDEEYEKLVDHFDAFLRGWEKEYNKKNKNNPKKKPIEERPFKPKIQDVAEHCSLEEIEEMLKDDPELSDHERFELYYEERERIKNEQEMDKMLKEVGLSSPRSKKNK